MEQFWERRNLVEIIGQITEEEELRKAAGETRKITLEEQQPFRQTSRIKKQAAAGALVLEGGDICCSVYQDRGGKIWGAGNRGKVAPTKSLLEKMANCLKAEGWEAKQKARDELIDIVLKKQLTFIKDNDQINSLEGSEFKEVMENYRREVAKGSAAWNEVQKLAGEMRERFQKQYLKMINSCKLVGALKTILEELENNAESNLCQQLKQGNFELLKGEKEGKLSKHAELIHLQRAIKNGKWEELMEAVLTEEGFFGVSKPFCALCKGVFEALQEQKKSGQFQEGIWAQGTNGQLAINALAVKWGEEITSDELTNASQQEKQRGQWEAGWKEVREGKEELGEFVNLSISEQTT